MATAQYPWLTTPVKGFFFVPAVDAERVRTEGLLEATRVRVYGKAVIGVKNGRYGVLFLRVR